ncbi:acyltransferase family protein [Raoultella planticola]|uniref:acyltransferase family protein n=1 Tax=Raoultella planticola TaxID=575 RepID=UPI00388E9DB3
MLDNKKQSYGMYITQRFFRIFPIYLFALILSMVMLSFTLDVLTLVPQSPATPSRIDFINQFYDHPILHTIFHFILMQGVIPGFLLEGSSFTILGQAWSVSVEWQFYLIAPLLFMLMNKIHKRKYFLILMVLVIACLIFGKVTDKGFYGNNLLAFSIGYITFYFYKYMFPVISKNQLRVVVAIFLPLSFIVLKKECIPVFIWVVSFYSVLKKEKEGVNNIVSKILDAKPILFIGRVSYSIYMVHMAVVFSFLKLFAGKETIPVYLYFAFPALCIIVSIVISGITYRLVEAPMISFGKKVTARFARSNSGPEVIS